MILETLAKTIQESPRSRRQISIATGVDASVIHRIVHGGSCSVETADRLCKELGLTLQPAKRKGGPRP